MDDGIRTRWVVRVTRLWNRIWMDKNWNVIGPLVRQMEPPLAVKYHISPMIRPRGIAPPRGTII